MASFSETADKIETLMLQGGFRKYGVHGMGEDRPTNTIILYVDPANQTIFEPLRAEIEEASKPYRLHIEYEPRGQLL